MVIGIEPADGGTAIDRYRALSGRWHHVVDATGIGKPDLEGCVVQPANGSPYDVQVSAHNAQGWGAWSELRTGTPIPIPSRTFPGAGGRCVAGLGHGRSPVSGHSGKLQSCNIDPDVGHTNSDTGRGCCRPAPRPAAHSSSSNLNAVMRMSSTAKSLAAVVVPQAPARFRAACPAATPASRTSYARFPLRPVPGCHQPAPRGSPHRATRRGVAGHPRGFGTAGKPCSRRPTSHLVRSSSVRVSLDCYRLGTESCPGAVRCLYLVPCSRLHY